MTIFSQTDNHSADGVLNSGGPLVALCKLVVIPYLVGGGLWLLWTLARAVSVVLKDENDPDLP